MCADCLDQINFQKHPAPAQPRPGDRSGTRLGLQRGRMQLQERRRLLEIQGLHRVGQDSQNARCNSPFLTFSAALLFGVLEVIERTRKQRPAAVLALEPLLGDQVVFNTALGAAIQSGVQLLVHHG